MKADSVKKNMLFQFAYQAIMLFIPLIISPYLTRRLGETSLGIYTYTYSIAYYFVMFSMLGIAKYGQRIIASRRQDSISLRRTFWSLFSLHILISILSVVVYIIFCVFVFKDTKIIYYAQTLYVLSAMFDIVWFFYGIEQFKIVVIRNTIVKILELLLIFTLVKTKDDILTYTLIMAGSVLAAQICVLPSVVKFVPPIKFALSDMKEHFKPMLVLSIAVIAIGLYTVFDKTLLGILASKEDVAFYEYSNRIISLPKTFIGVIGTVLFPRACNCIANNDFSQAKKYYKYSLLAVYFIGIGSIFGIIAVADLLSVVYYGEAFYICGNVMKAMVPLVLIIGVGEIVRLQFLIPLKKDALYTIGIIINAVINIAISVLLIPKLGIYGAILGTISAEMFGLLFQGYLVKQYIDIKNTLLTAVPFVISGSIMLLTIEAIKLFYNSTVIHLSIQVVVGALAYVISLVILLLTISVDKESNREIINSIIRKKKT